MTLQLTSLFLLLTAMPVVSETPYEIIRLNNRQPIISKAHFEAAGVPSEGNNINGPSLIRVPEWIPPAERAHQEAIYYLYFADHGGHHIRMAWAAHLEGPWHLYQTGTDVLPGKRGVLDLGPENALDLGNSIRIHNHIASPDVHVDHENRRILMYFHAPTNHAEEGKGQVTFAATSADGLNFNNPEQGGQPGHGIRPVMLGRFYFRVFVHNEELYAIGNFGRLYKARDPRHPWTPSEDHDYGAYLWHEGRNPFRDALVADGIEDVYPRHFAVRQVGDRLHAIYSRIGDAPERLLLSTIDLTQDWMQWTPSYPPREVLRAEEAWEGAHFEVQPSNRGRIYGKVNQLRDPCLFEDHDGQWYLLYSGQGESAIGIASIRLLDETD